MAPYSGHMLDRVARSGTERLLKPSPQNSTNLLTTPWLRSISVSVRTRSVAVAPGRKAPANRTPTTTGVGRYIAWPSRAASASMPPTPQPSTPSPFTMVVWESVPTRVSGIAIRRPSSSRTCTTRLTRSRFTWWQMPMPGGTTRKLWKARCAQRSTA